MTVADSPFRRDLYRGTARYYDAYRMAYPPELAADLTRRVSANGTGRLLDLACGTGQVTFLLAPSFSTVLGVDRHGGAGLAESRAARHLPCPFYTGTRGDRRRRVRPF